jgi:diacylglycerol kinase (ATP)
MNNPHKGRTGIDRVIHAFGYSRDGVVAAVKGESAFRQEAALAVVMLIACVYAVLGVQVVLLPAIALATSLFAQYKDKADLQLPAAIPLMVVGVWLLFVNARILSAATTWNLWPCLGLVFAQGLLSRLIEMSLLPGVAAAS